MKLQARNFVVRKPETIDITMFFKKFCIATRTTEPLIFQGFCFFLAAFHPNLTPTDLILGWDYTPWDMVG